MQMRIMVTTLVLSLVTANTASADSISVKAQAVASLYSGSSTAATTLLSSVMDTVKAESEREMELNLAAVGEVLDFLKAPPMNMTNPQYVGTYRGLFVPFPMLHGMGSDMILVTTGGKSIGNTPAVVVEKAGGALWFSAESMVKEDVTIGGVKYWKIMASFRTPSQKVPTLPASLRQERGATWDKYGWYVEFNVICPNQADASTPSAATAPTTTTVAPTAPPATPRVRRRAAAACRI